MHPTLLPALSGHRQRFDGLSCYVAGHGRPLMLVHGPGLAASAAELRPIYERLRGTRTVVAPDLPGFGFSQRGPQDYTPRLMTDALHATLGWIHRHRSGARVDALGLGLGCEFLARAAYEAPTHFGRLAFVSPTGLDGQRAWRALPGRTREVPGLHALLSKAPWSRWLYEQMTRPQALRQSLQGAFGRPLVDEMLWADAVDNARQPGAWHAPLAFLSGRLFSADIHRLYDGLTQPVWLSHGRNGDFTDFGALERMPATRHWLRTAWPTGALPHFELPHEFNRLLDDFLNDTLQHGMPQDLHAPAPPAPLRASGALR